jgi:hypothetical protein
MRGNSSGRSKNLCASTKLIGLMSTTVNRRPRRDSLVAISAAAAQHEDLLGAGPKFVHHPDIREHAVAVGRRLTLPHASFELNARAVPGTLDDFDLPVPPLIT